MRSSFISLAHRVAVDSEKALVQPSQHWRAPPRQTDRRCEGGRGHAEHSLTQLPRCSRPMTSGSQGVNAYSEISRPKALSPGHAFMKSLTRKPFPAPTSETR